MKVKKLTVMALLCAIGVTILLWRVLTMKQGPVTTPALSLTAPNAAKWCGSFDSLRPIRMTSEER